MSAVAYKLDPPIWSLTRQTSSSTESGRKIRECTLVAAEHGRKNVSDWRYLANTAIENAAREAESDNWDGGGAKALAPAAKLYAQSLVDVLPAYLPEPDTVPEPDGDLALIWDLGRNAVFSLSISGSGMIHYAGVIGEGEGNRRHGVAEFQGETPPAVAKALEDLARLRVSVG